jgi:hypothetical protein
MQVDIFLLLSLLILSVLFLLELTSCPARHTRRSVGMSHSRTQWYEYSVR